MCDNVLCYFFFWLPAGSDIVAQSQADICRLRFNSSMAATLFAVNRHVNAPGFSLYSSGKPFIFPKVLLKMLFLCYKNDEYSANTAFLYIVDARKAIEYNNTRKSWNEAAEYLASHPDFWSTFGAQENVAKSSNDGTFQTDDIKLGMVI